MVIFIITFIIIFQDLVEHQTDEEAKVQNLLVDVGHFQMLLQRRDS